MTNEHPIGAIVVTDPGPTHPKDLGLATGPTNDLICG
jgi:hypothetical protein